MWCTHRDNRYKLFQLYSSVKNSCPLLTCSHGVEKRGARRKEKKVGIYSICITQRRKKPLSQIILLPLSHVPSSSTSDSMSFTSSFVAIIPRFFMTSSSSSVVMVWLLSTSKILNASLNSRMINRRALVGYVWITELFCFTLAWKIHCNRNLSCHAKYCVTFKILLCKKIFCTKISTSSRIILRKTIPMMVITGPVRSSYQKDNNTVKTETENLC